MSRLLVILSGSVAAYKACAAISQLVQRGHEVQTVATAAARRFVGVATLEALTGRKAGTELFEPGGAMEHLDYSRWADLTLVAPATAHTLNRLAAGLGDDLAGAVLLAHDWRKPLLLAPAMNPAMWSHPATQASLARLQQWGGRLIPVGSGRMACGETGEGRLAEPEEIVRAVEAALAPADPRLRVLITSGGTAEPIDGVRVLTNTSTGSTGARLADELSRRGHAVTLVRARSALRPQRPCRETTFVTFSDLDEVLERELGGHDYDAVIHAAAVGDFAIARVEVAGAAVTPGHTKLCSETPPTLHLRANPKLLPTLRPRSRQPGIRVVAFKLTHGALSDEARTAALALCRDGAADLVVHNDIAARRDGEGAAFPATLWRADGRCVAECADRSALAGALADWLVAEPAPAGIDGQPNL